MMTADVIPYRLRRWLATTRHNHAIAAIEQTPPIKQAKSGLMFLSMLQHVDVRMYLVAIKSVYVRIGPASITIIDDGSLTSEDRRLLHDHLGEIRYIPIGEINTSPFPKGGTWERLLSIIDLTRDQYVIQLDADIVCVGDLDEVVECIRENRGFTLAAGRTSTLETLAETSAVAKGWGEANTIQVASEQILDEMPYASSMRYIRGCSAFAGFPRGSDGRDGLLAFSDWLEKRLGRRWHEWGSEQVASNFVVANCSEPLPLPWSKYQSYDIERGSADTASLIHFYGTHRFEHGVYTAQSRRVIATLIGTSL
jgi:hypothetical protein